MNHHCYDYNTFQAQNIIQTQLNGNLNNIVQMQNVLQGWVQPIYPATLFSAPYMCGRIMNADERLKERTKDLLKGPLKELKEEIKVARQSGLNDKKIADLISDELTKLIIGLKT